MKDIILDCAAILLVLIYSGCLKITFSPFSISFPGWHYFLGILIIVFGMFVFTIGQRQLGYNEGMDKATKIFYEVLDKKAKQSESEPTQ